MSTIRTFFAKMVTNNPEWQAKINAAESAADIVKLGAAAGYSFTEEAVTSFIESLKSGSHELLSEELETVAGGMPCTFSAYTKHATGQGTKCCYG
ncbi:MAG: Nif11-like leader peptide family RiPP precursor [Pseudomonadota bacterium]